MLRRLPKIKINSLIIFNTFDLPRSFIKIIQNRFTLVKSDYECLRCIVDSIQFKKVVYKNGFQLLKTSRV